MGLDMYLTATQRIDKLNWGVLKENKKLDLDSPLAVYPQFNDLMELTEMKGVATDIYGANIEVTCAYWRKANQIHNWFVTNVQGGEDNCGHHEVAHEQLEELLALCKDALAQKNPSLLPTLEGCFFGGTDIDQYYWEQIKDTIEQLNRVLALPNVDKLWFNYQSSW